MLKGNGKVYFKYFVVIMVDFFNIILIGFISFLPIVLWAYIFSYINNDSLNRKRFFVGIIAGITSVFPIFYMDKIISGFDFKYLNIFSFANNINSFYSSFEFGLSLQIFLSLFVVISFLIILLFFRHKQNIAIILRNAFSFVGFIFIIILFVFILSKVSFLDNKISESLVFMDLIFDSFKLVIFYYIIVAFLEESSKHFNFLSTDIFKIDSIKTGVLYAIFVALGFSFAENILYIKNIFSTSGFTYDLVQVYFFRAIFSVIVHVLCSSVLAFAFMKSYFYYKEKKLDLNYFKILAVGFFSSIVLHLIFDVSLTLNFSFIMLIYMVLAYLYIGNIFYRD